MAIFYNLRTCIVNVLCNVTHWTLSQMTFRRRWQWHMRLRSRHALSGHDVGLWVRCNNRVSFKVIVCRLLRKQTRRSLAASRVITTCPDVWRNARMRIRDWRAHETRVRASGTTVWCPDSLTAWEVTSGVTNSPATVIYKDDTTNVRLCRTTIP